MKARGWLFPAAALIPGLTAVVTAQQSQSSPPAQLTVTIDTGKTAAPISKYLYGGFIEHIGTLIYRSLWSEMLDDRKFYFPISSKDAAQPESASARPGRMPVRK